MEQECGVTSALDPGLLVAAGELACGRSQKADGGDCASPQDKAEAR